ncbi:MAG TPA: hypothetical protein VI874_01370 [Candidatus Norongarragalinales archaeon]|nr:hypothetical protein [Candidatus Norongarragalinales archaeon]
MKLLLAILIVAGLASSVRLYGVVYDSQLEPVTKVLLQINTTPAQRLVSPDGAYAFTLPAGNYELSATKANASVLENLTLSREGEYRFDLIFLPDLPTDVDEIEDALLDNDVPSTDLAENGPNVPWFLWALGLGGLTLASWFFLRQHSFKAERKTAPVVEKETRTMPVPSSHTRHGLSSPTALTPDQKRVLQTLESLNNRAPQKELRKAMNEWSEAKVSLELTELEDAGLIRKIKKGRGNVIKRT